MLPWRPPPMALTGGAVLFARRLQRRARRGVTLTEWMGEAPTGEAVRIGLGHGSIRDFRSVEEMGGEGQRGDPARPRAALGARLSGAWRLARRIEVGPRTWYSGTPEPDQFQSPIARRGALLVAIPAPGAEVEVTEVENGGRSAGRA